MTDFVSSRLLTSKDFASGTYKWEAEDLGGGALVAMRALRTDVPSKWKPAVADMRTGAVSVYGVGTGYDQYDVAIWGNRLVYSDARSGDSQIYLYDVATGTESRLSPSTENQSRPDIWGNVVVWEDYRHGLPCIYVCNLLTGVASRLTFASGVQQMPSISGNTVLYTDTSTGGGDIYALDLASGSTNRITAESHAQMFAQRDGFRVVYQDDRTGTMDLYLFDLQTGTETLVAGGTGDQELASISGTRIAYTSDADGNDDALIRDIHLGDAGTVTPRDSDSQERAVAIEGNLVLWYNPGPTSEVSLAQVSAPSITLRSLGIAIPYGAQVGIAGSISDLGIGIGRGTMHLEKSDNGFSWQRVNAVPSVDDGLFVAKSPPSMVRALYRITYDGKITSEGTLAHLSAESAPLAVVPLAYLTTPSGPSRISRTRYITSTGYFAPQVPPGSKPLYVKAYRYERGKWVARKTWYPATSISGDKSKYSVKYKLSAGKWRIRAVFPGSAMNAKTVTGYRYIRVY